MIAALLGRLRCWIFHTRHLTPEGAPAHTWCGMVLPMVCLFCGHRWLVPYYGGLT